MRNLLESSNDKVEAETELLLETLSPKVKRKGQDQITERELIYNKHNVVDWFSTGYSCRGVPYILHYTQ